MCPRFLESSIDARGLVRSVAGAKTNRESVERPSIFRVLLQVVAKDRLRISGLASRQQLHAERFTHRKVPRRRLFVVERVLDRNRVLQILRCVLMMALRGIDLARDRRRRHREQPIRRVETHHSIRRRLRCDRIELLLFSERIVGTILRREREAACVMPDRSRVFQIRGRRLLFEDRVPLAEARFGEISRRRHHFHRRHLADRVERHRVVEFARGFEGAAAVALHHVRRPQELNIVRHVHRRVDALGIALAQVNLVGLDRSFVGSGRRVVITDAKVDMRGHVHDMAGGGR